MSTSQICCYDFRLSENLTDGEGPLIEFLSNNCKQWAFQLEKGKENGYLHYQGRLSLNNRAFKHQVAKAFIEFDPKWSDIYLGPTVKGNQKGEAFYKCYITKDETRVGGPWMDADRENNNYVPKQIRQMTELYPWQKSCLEMSTIWDIRRIPIIIDDAGGKGKTSFALWMHCMKHTYYLPFVSGYKDLLQAVMDRPSNRKGYIIDVPRGMAGERMNEFFSALELIKGGYAYDGRYKFKDRVFDTPFIMTYINLDQKGAEKVLKLLSKDRFLFLRINKNLELKRHPIMKTVEEDL